MQHAAMASIIATLIVLRAAKVMIMDGIDIRIALCATMDRLSLDCSLLLLSAIVLCYEIVL